MGQIKTRSVFVTSPILGKVQKQDFVNNQALTKRILIFALFRKTQILDRFQTDFRQDRGQNGVLRRFVPELRRKLKKIARRI